MSNYFDQDEATQRKREVIDRILSISSLILGGSLIIYAATINEMFKLCLTNFLLMFLILAIGIAIVILPIYVTYKIIIKVLEILRHHL